MKGNIFNPWPVVDCVIKIIVESTTNIVIFIKKTAHPFDFF